MASPITLNDAETVGDWTDDDSCSDDADATHPDVMALFRCRTQMGQYVDAFEVENASDYLFERPVVTTVFDALSG